MEVGPALLMGHAQGRAQHAEQPLVAVQTEEIVEGEERLGLYTVHGRYLRLAWVMGLATALYQERTGAPSS